MNLFEYLFGKLFLGLVSIAALFSSVVDILPPVPIPTIRTPSAITVPADAPPPFDIEIPLVPQPATTSPRPQSPQPSPAPALSPSPTPLPAETLPFGKVSAGEPPPPAPTAEPAPSPTASVDLNTKTREALVNILCTTPAGGPLKPLSGSGVIIDPRGVVITNAHVAQFFLLRDYPTPGNVDCVLRAGSPARTMYRAELLYLPPSWIERNAYKITQQVPTGTGEDDFALLRITGRTDPDAPLPASFPYVSYRLDDNFEVGDPLLIAAYPAGFLGGATVQTSLFISSALSDIKEVYTYDTGSIDLVSVGGTVVSQQGSSGGAVMTIADQKLAGVIVTSTIAETTAERDLRAITLYHVNESMKKNTGFDLPFLLFGDLSIKASAFNLTTAPTLTRALIAELKK